MRKTVFLSSTSADLGPFRAQIVEDARGYDWFRIDAMEEFGARSAPPIAFCRRRVEEADIFAGLIGNYRGWEPDGDNKQRSITEMEYDWAVDAKKRRLMFVAPEDFGGTAAPSDGEAGARQRQFRVRVTSSETADLRCFGSADTLSKAFFKALFNEVMYDLAAQAKTAPDGPGRLDAAAMAGAALAAVAQEENLSLEEMRAKGLGLTEIEAALTKRAQAAEASAAHHREAGSKAREEGALAWKNLGALAFAYDTAKAMDAYGKAAALDSQDWEALWYLGRLRQRGGYLPAAKNSYESLLARQESIDNPSFIHWGYFLLGDVEAGLGNRSTALDHYERGQALVQALAARDPSNAEWQRDLSVSYDRVGDISAARGDRDGALKAYKDGLDIRKALAARDPSNVVWQTDLVVSGWKLASAGAADAARHLAEGLAILKRLHAEGRLTADQEGWIAPFEAALQEPAGEEPEAKAEAAPWWKFWRS